jgi:hypothetical protein
MEIRKRISAKRGSTLLPEQLTCGYKNCIIMKRHAGRQLDSRCDGLF